MHAGEGSATGKSFWKTVKPFISTKGTLSSDNIIIEVPNNTKINIKEKTSGLTPKSIGNPSNSDHDRSTVKEIIENYKNHPSIIKIKECSKNLTRFDFPKPTAADISLIIKSLNPKKATGPDGIPIKTIKYASNAIDSHLSNIIAKDLEINKYSEEPKTALVRPIFKKMKEIK